MYGVLDSMHRLIIYVLPLEVQLSRREDWDSLNRFNPATFLCLSQPRTWISTNICGSIFCVQRVNMWCDCSFCLYSWNCFNFLFINKMENRKYSTIGTVLKSNEKRDKRDTPNKYSYPLST